MDGVVDPVRYAERSLLHRGMTAERDSCEKEPRRQRGRGLSASG
jgi:hypothetical protein